MSMTLRRTGQALLAAALVALLASLMIGGSQAVRTSAAQSKSSDNVSARDDVALLRRAIGPNEAVPARWLNMAVESGIARDAIAKAHRVNVGRASNWVIDAGDRVCQMQVIDDAMSYACVDPKQLVEEGRLSVNTGSGFGLSKDELRVSGIVPDGATDTAFVLADGTRVPRRRLGQRVRRRDVAFHQPVPVARRKRQAAHTRRLEPLLTRHHECSRSNNREHSSARSNPDAPHHRPGL